MANVHLPTRAPLRGEILSAGAPDPHARALFLDWISFIMDRWFQVPGTRLRFGLNSILLLLPVLGDIIPTLISVAILLVGLRSYQVPRIVAARMVLNSLLDASLGWIPVLGDLFDLFFKADTRNVRLLQEYAGLSEHPPRATWRHWIFVVGVLLCFLIVLALVTWATIALGYWLVGLFRRHG